MTTQKHTHQWAHLALTICLAVLAQTKSFSQADFLVDLGTVDWIHGSTDCDALQRYPDYQEWQQIEYYAETYVFRQNKCSNYEAPFAYLFLGSESGLLIDTGATVDGGPILLEMISAITTLPITVAHSHGHGDHRRGDAAFATAEGFTVAGNGQEAVQSFFEFADWPYSAVSLNLGGRTIEILPIPGHSDDHLAFYDSLSEVVITGDSLYPGRLYVRDWELYSESISRLADWLADKSVSIVLGTHIEMSTTPNIDYPVETLYQPEEHQLPMSLNEIRTLRDALARQKTPERIYLDSFIVWPVQ